MRVFTAAPAVDLVRMQIVRAAHDCSFAIPAYCFMPDHLHLFVEAKSETSDGREFIKRARQYSGFYYSKTYGSKLWQRYGYDHVVRDDEKAIIFIRYILGNPIKAGLVKRIEDYPFVGSLEWPLEALADWVSKK